MASQKQTMVETTPTDYKMGSAGSQGLQKLFAGSPIYKGNISDSERVEYFQDNVMDGVRNTGFGLDGFDTEFVDAPELSEVKTGDGGLPASPYVPNRSSPGEGSQNATDQPEAPEGFGKNPNSQYGVGPGHALSPKASAEKIAAQKLGDYVMGKSSQE